jgi:hypothetical protein
MAASDELDTLATQARNASDGLAGLYGTLSKGNASLQTANDLLKGAANTAASGLNALGPAGAAAGTALKTGAAAVGALNDQSDRLNRTFNTIGASGGALGQNFSTMRDQASKFGQAIGSNEQMAQQYAKIVGQNSKDLARFGGNVTDGTNRLAKSSEAMSGVRLQLQNLGISYEDQVEGLADYTKQMAQTGRAQRMTNDELAQGAANYLRSMNDLAAVTGVNTKEQKAAREQALNEQRFGAVMIMQEQKAQELERAGRRAEAKTLRDGMENMQQFNSVVANMSPELAKGMRDMAAGVTTSPEAKKAIQMTGGMGMQIMQDLKKGTISSQEALQRLGQATGQTVDRMAPLAATSDAYSKNFTSITEAQKIRQLADNNIAKQAADAQEKRIKQEKDLEGEVAQTNKAMNSLRVAQQVGEKALDPARREVLNQTSKLAQEMAGAAPEIGQAVVDFTAEIVKATTEIRSFSDALKYAVNLSKKLSDKITGGDTRPPGPRLENMPPPASAAAPGGARPPAGPPAAAPPGGGGRLQNMPPPGNTRNLSGPATPPAGEVNAASELEGLNIKRGAFSESGAKLSAQVINAAKDVLKSFPNARITSLNDPIKGRSATSAHNQGRAMDIVVAPNEVEALTKYLQEIGAKKVLNETRAPANPAAAKSWAPHIHAEFAKGGIADGPMSGYFAKLHGAEAVIPLPDNKKIPVQIKMPQISMPQIGQDMFKQNNLMPEGFGLDQATKGMMNTVTTAANQATPAMQDKTADALNNMAGVLRQMLTVQNDQKLTMTKMLQLQRN